MKICEIFPSIQGESSLVGIPMLFIRLTGCNLRCKYCDTQYAYTVGDDYSIEDVINIIKRYNFDYVEITGGEPLLQVETYELIERLVVNKKVLLETNGSISIEKINPKVKIILDIKTPGSGMCEKNFLKNLDYIKESDEIKFVLTDRSDYEWAKNFLKKYPVRAREILFSPAFNFLNPRSLAEWIINDKLNVRLNLQIHKYLSIK